MESEDAAERAGDCAEYDVCACLAKAIIEMSKHPKRARVARDNAAAHADTMPEAPEKGKDDEGDPVDVHGDSLVVMVLYALRCGFGGDLLEQLIEANAPRRAVFVSAIARAHHGRIIGAEKRVLCLHKPQGVARAHPNKGLVLVVLLVQPFCHAAVVMEKKDGLVGEDDLRRVCEVVNEHAAMAVFKNAGLHVDGRIVGCFLRNNARLRRA